MIIQINPKAFFTWLVVTIFVLCFLGSVGVMANYHYAPHMLATGFFELFDLDTELNVPTFFSILILLFASILLFLIFLVHKQQQISCYPWFWLAAIFLFLAYDEYAGVHNLLVKPTRRALGTSGFLFYAWIIPYSILLVVFLAVYIRFLFRLPKFTMRLFVGSGVIYVVGAIGLEAVGGRHEDLYGSYQLIYALYYTCEEVLEMLGVAIFIFALLDYLTDKLHFRSISISRNLGP